MTKIVEIIEKLKEQANQVVEGIEKVEAVDLTNELDINNFSCESTKEYLKDFFKIKAYRYMAALEKVNNLEVNLLAMIKELKCYSADLIDFEHVITFLKEQRK